MAVIASILSLFTLLWAFAGAQKNSGDGWTSGRGTWYDGIHQGSCEFYQLPYNNNGQGWFIAAMSDQDPNYQGSCGRCYEVACQNKEFKDGYGNLLNRASACKDESKAVYVKITDTCPCVYPANAYSNKRWCCGDMHHFDMSDRAFAALGDLKLGVMGITYRPVDCKLWEAADGTPHTIGSGDSASPGALSLSNLLNSSSIEAPQPSDLRVEAFDASTSSPSDSSSSSSSPEIVKGGELQNGWSDVSYGTKEVYHSGAAYCASVTPGGAIAFAASSPNAFSGKSSVSVSVDTSDGTPPVSVSVEGSGGSSQSQNLSGSSGQFSYTSGVDTSKLQKVVLKNSSGAQIGLCVKEVSLV